MWSVDDKKLDLMGLGCTQTTSIPSEYTSVAMAAAKLVRNAFVAPYNTEIGDGRNPDTFNDKNIEY